MMNRMSDRCRAMVLRCWLLLAGSLLLSDCTSDDDHLSLYDVIVGTWALDRYELQTDTGVEVAITHVTFMADGRASVTYFDGSGEEGRFEAGDAFIRIDYDDPSGQQGHLLWEVLDFTDKTMTVSYTNTEQHLSATLWLVKDA